MALSSGEVSLSSPSLFFCALMIFLMFSLLLSAIRHNLASLPMRSSRSDNGLIVAESSALLASLLSCIMASLFFANWSAENQQNRYLSNIIR